MTFEELMQHVGLRTIHAGYSALPHVGFFVTINSGCDDSSTGQGATITEALNNALNIKTSPLDFWMKKP